MAQTPEQKADAEWRVTEAARVRDEKRRSAQRERRLADARQAHEESKIRKDVYAELKYPEEGDPEAEAEIERRIGVESEPPPGYMDVMDREMAEAGITAGDDDGERDTGDGSRDTGAD